MKIKIPLNQDREGRSTNARWTVEIVEEAKRDIPNMSTTQDWVLWDIDILKNRKKRPPPVTVPQSFTPLRPPPPPPPELLMVRNDVYHEPNSPKGFSLKSPRFSKTEV